jgi:hypothetical protein
MQNETRSVTMIRLTTAHQSYVWETSHSGSSKACTANRPPSVETVLACVFLLICCFDLASDNASGVFSVLTIVVLVWDAVVGKDAPDAFLLSAWNVIWGGNSQNGARLCPVSTTTYLRKVYTYARFFAPKVYTKVYTFLRGPLHLHYTTLSSSLILLHNYSIVHLIKVHFSC